MRRPLRQLLSTKQIGNKYESIARAHLETNGLKILKKNYLCKLGEIDIIALHNDIVVFCEVRSKSNTYFGQPEETVDSNKQQRIHRAANHFLINTPRLKNSFCRFDVISIIFNNDHHQINWIRNAF